jgi:transposase-like protein
MSGHVEADETYIGGRARFMHKQKRVYKQGPAGKLAVMGLLQRSGPGKRSRVHLQEVPNVRGHRLHKIIKANVERGSSLYTDALKSYSGLTDDYKHHVIDHAESYAEGAVHTNGLENFWSLLKRTLKGTYISVEPFHLFRYLDEQAYRFNNRKTNDVARFIDALGGLVGKRLTYANLTAATT